MIIKVSFWGYLKTMWTLFYTSFTNPTRTTVINWQTGKIVDVF